MEDKKSWNSNDLREEELEILKSITNKTELVKTTKWGGIYVVNNKNVIGIGGFKNFFTIWFFNCVFLKDELNVLVNTDKIEKKTKLYHLTSATFKNPI